MLLLVLLGVQNHHHTAGEKEENVPKLRGVLRSRDIPLPTEESPQINKAPSEQKILSVHLLLQVSMLRILGHFTLLLTLLLKHVLK